MARKSGWAVNDKRIRRLWCEEGLRVPQRRKKKRLTGVGVTVGAMCPIRPNVIWAMDFQFDTLADGRTIKLLNIIDEYTRECLAIEIGRSIDADQVVAVLDTLALTRGAPVYVRFDNGPEFVAQRYCQDLWMSGFQAASWVPEVASGSTSLPFSKVAPSRTSFTRCGALTARHFDCAASISL